MHAAGGVVQKVSLTVSDGGDAEASEEMEEPHLSPALLCDHRMDTAALLVCGGHTGDHSLNIVLVGCGPASYCIMNKHVCLHGWLRIVLCVEYLTGIK